jgi:hypothetical protein
VGSINREIKVQVGLGKKQDLISKMARAKWAGGVAHLPSTCLASTKLYEFKSLYCKKKKKVTTNLKINIVNAKELTE